MEILTVQLGDYSSFVGCHYWNLQAESKAENVIQSVLFSEGADQIFTPRLLLVDLKESFGTLGLQNSNVQKSSLDAVSLSGLWDAPMQTVESAPYHRNSFVRALDDAYEQLTVGLDAPIAKKERALKEIEAQLTVLLSTRSHAASSTADLYTIEELKLKKEELLTDISRMNKRLQGEKLDADEEVEKNTFEDLDESVHYWSDYLKTYIAPRSLYEFKAYSIDDKFDSFPMGHQLMRSEDERDELEGRLHKQLEDCDGLQGLQMMVDVDNGFGAMGVDFVEMLRDEVPKQPIQLYAFYGRKSDVDKQQNEKRLANMALSFAHLSDLCTTYIPLSSKHLTSTGSQTDTFNRLTFDTRKPYHTSALFAAGLDMISRPLVTRGSGASLHTYATTLAEVPERNICSIEMSLPFDGEQVVNLFDEKRNPFAHSSYIYSLTPNLAKDAAVLPFGSVVSLYGVSTCGPVSNSKPIDLLNRYCRSYAKQCFSSPSPFFLPLSYPKFFADKSLTSVQSMVHLQNTQQQYYNIKLLADAISSIDITRYPEYELTSKQFKEVEQSILSKSDFYKKRSFD